MMLIIKILLSICVSAIIAILTVSYLSRKNRMSPSIYRHLKTGGKYEVLHIGVDERTQAPKIIYRSATGQAPVWIRDYDEFLDGRFRHVSGPTIRDIIILLKGKTYHERKQ